MAGELWLQQARIGKETTAGTLVNATRKVFVDAPQLTEAREMREKRFLTGTRDNVRDVKKGPSQVSGQVRVPMSADEIIEWLLCSVQGGVTPSTPGGTLPRLWVFKPSNTLDSLTFEYNDGATAWRGAGVRANQLTIEGDVEGENWLTCELMGLSRTAAALTGSPADRVPDSLEGWQAKIYIDAFGGTPGTTVQANAMINWRVIINNNMTRKYFADNTRNPNALVNGALDINAEITFEASSAVAASQLTNWDTDVARMVRLEFLGPTNGIETGYNRFVTIDIPGNWNMPDFLGENNGTRVYTFNLQYKYDPTNTWALQVRAQNARATPY